MKIFRSEGVSTGGFNNVIVEKVLVDVRVGAVNEEIG